VHEASVSLGIAMMQQGNRMAGGRSRARLQTLLLCNHVHSAVLCPQRSTSVHS
jgi:hypothetical protein